VTRVLFVNLYYPPHHLGGYEASCRDVAVRLRERGHDVAVLTSTLRRDGMADPPGERDGELPVWRDLTAYLRADGLLWSPSIARRWRIERANQRALERALDTHRPDVVSVWQLGALSVGLMSTLAERNIPLVYSVCDDWLSYALELDAWHRLFVRLPHALRRLAGAVTRVATTVPDLGTLGPLLFVSELTRQRARTYARWSMDDTAVVHSGVDTRAFSPDPGADGPRPWTGRLLYAGRYDPRKGIETAIRALVHLPDETLEIRATGNVEEKARLEEVARDLGLLDRVEFSVSSREGLADDYRSADVVLFPSEWEEPFGLVPLEAMACGTPVAASGVGASIPFLVDGINSVRFAPGDVEGLAAAVRRVRDDGSLRAQLVHNGFATARFFDVERLADTFEAWHEAAAQRFTHGRPPERRFSIAEVVDR
jgi:glycogen(starch) synthase